MSFSIRTNTSSLTAQENLRVNQEFQSTTIQRLTSGYRINQSGDDAAGLAIANKYRSDVTELTQGVRNANDGISTLQIVDGGMNNISKMIDRLKTLATQSASGTFTGNRDVVNDEFQGLLSEIDRQAQAIGLQQGGRFAKSLSVFIGGGTTSTGAVDIANGTVTVDLSRSMVDASSLGLKGMQATSASGTDLSAGSATSVASIVENTNNQSASRTPGYSEFYFSGAGFSDADKIGISVNLSGVADTASAVNAINAAIEGAAGQSTEAAKAFAAAGIKASVITTDGKETIGFTSSTAAFQIQAGDKVANALLGNFAAGAEGKAVSQTIAGLGVTSAAGTLAAGRNIVVRIQGGGMDSPVDISLTGATGGSAIADVLTSLKAAVDGNAELAAAGISLATPTAGAALAFTSATGETFEVMTAGDTGNLLGMGFWALNDPTVASFDASTVTAAAAANINNAAAVTYSLEISIAGGATQSISVTTAAAGATISTVQDQLNAAIANNSNLTAAGLKFTNAGGKLTLASSNETAFRVNETSTDAASFLGFKGTASATVTTSTASFGTTALNYQTTVNSGGANNTALGANNDVFAFSAIRSGGDDQTVSLTAVDANGTQHKVSVVLRNDATSRNGATIDSAIDAINTALQQSNDATMKNLVAVKEVNFADNAEGIRFMAPSTVDFQVSIGTNGGAAGIKDTVGATAQGLTYASEQADGGSTIDVSTQEGAQAAVRALASAVTLLGSAQAAVGKAQNTLGYAIGLAQSQSSSFATAESRIRDADIAAEAANLTKAQTLQQTTMAAMAQANSAPQQVMTLLRG